MPAINWDASKEDAALIRKIVARYAAMNGGVCPHQSQEARRA